MYRKRTTKDHENLVERPEIVWTPAQEKRALRHGWSHESEYIDANERERIESYLIDEAKRNRATERYLSRLPKQERWEMMRSRCVGCVCHNADREGREIEGMKTFPRFPEMWSKWLDWTTSVGPDSAATLLQ